MRIIPNRQTLIASAVAVGLSLSCTALAASQPGQNSPDEQGTSQKSSSAQQQQASRYSDQQQNQQQQESGNISGQVLSYREVNVEGQQHFRAKIQSGANGTQSVDFGPSDRASDVVSQLEQGDHIKVQGQPQKLDGKSVIVASRVQLDGKWYDLSQENGSTARGGQTSPSSQERSGMSGSQADSQQSQQNGQRPEEEVLLDQRFVFVDEGNLNQHLILARQELAAGDSRCAAGELRTAADRLELYANSAQQAGDARNALSSARKELNRLASEASHPKQGNESAPNTSNSSDQTLKDLDQAAAHAQLALARFFDERVSQQQEKNPVEVGYCLQAAATHARDAMIWGGEQPSWHEVHALRQAFRASDQLISEGQQDAKSTQIATNLRKQIDAVDQQLGQSQQAQPAGERQSAESNDESRESQSAEGRSGQQQQSSSSRQQGSAQQGAGSSRHTPGDVGE